jgi:hypothetical protein
MHNNRKLTEKQKRDLFLAGRWNEVSGARIIM